MERNIRPDIYFRRIGYNKLIQDGLSHDEIAKKDVDSITTVPLLDSKCNVRRVGIRTDPHWLENIGRHEAGVEMIDSNSWEVPV